MELFNHPEFIARVKEYNDIPKDNKTEKDAFYTEKILPEIYKKLKQENHLKVENLIILGSGQANTAALLISVLNPKRLAFLLTDRTRTFPQQVCTKLQQLVDVDVLNCPINKWPYVDITEAHAGINPDFFKRDHSSITGVYKGLKDIVSYWKNMGIDHSEIYLDLTGGMSTMTVGAAKAAHIAELSSIYIISEYHDNQIVEGTQRIETVPNPYSDFGDLEAEEAKRLFSKHNYNGAQRIFNKLAGKLPDNKSFSLYADLSEAYNAWEVLNFDRAAKKLTVVLENIDHDPLLQRYTPHIREQLISATELTEITSSVAKKDPVTQLNVLSNHTKVLYLLSTLRAIAERRASDERYDVAALYMYRSLELIIQHRLAKYGLLTDKPEFTALLVSRNDLEAKYKSVRSKLKAKQGRESFDDTSSIALLEGGIFLKALDDGIFNSIRTVNKDIIDDFKLLKHIMLNISVRNNSILAHGYQLIKHNDYEKFAQVSSRWYEGLIFLNKEDVTLWQTRSQFIQPFTEA